MCVPLAAGAAIVGAAAAVAGAGVSYEQGQNAASAANQAQQEAMQSQSTAFNARMQAQQEQLAGETTANNEEANTFQKNQQAQQEAQMSDIAANQKAVGGINSQEQAIADQANQVVQQGVQATSGQNLAAAQAQQQAQQQAMNAPVSATAGSTNPLGNESSDTATAGAMAGAQKEAESYVSKYGDTQAKLNSYSAPIQLANTTSGNIQDYLMPLNVQDQLLKSSAPAILAPSNLAYEQAGTYGNAVQAANQSNTDAFKGVVDASAANAEALADQNQGDTNVNTQNTLSAAQQRAANLAALGQGLTSVGDGAIQVGASQGGLKQLYNIV